MINIEIIKIGKNEISFVKKDRVHKCINIMVIEGKLIKLLPLFIAHKLFCFMFSEGTFTENIYIFKEKNIFKVVLLKKELFLPHHNSDKYKLTSFELLFNKDFEVMYKAIKKFSKVREFRFSLLSYDNLLTEILELFEQLK